MRPFNRFRAAVRRVVLCCGYYSVTTMQGCWTRSIPRSGKPHGRTGRKSQHQQIHECRHDRNSCTGRSRPGAAGRGPGKERLQRRGPGPAAPGGMCCNRFARLAHLPAGQFFSFDAIYKRNPPIFLANCRRIRYTYIVTNGEKARRTSLRKRKMILPCVPERKGA